MACLLLFAILPSIAAWSFTLTSTPTVCSTLSLQITGGVSPHELLFAHFPPANSSQASNSSAWTSTVSRWWVLNLDGTSSANETSFTTVVAYVFGPESAGSRFVIVGSDATGFGTGGITELLAVNPSPSSGTCQTVYTNATEPMNAFSDLPTSVGQCAPSAQFAGNLTGPITADLLVPGHWAVEYSVPNPYENDTSVQGSADPPWASVEWDMPSFPVGTEVALVLGYEGGNPVLVSPLMTIQEGDTCSTSSSSSSKTGAIAGGVVGGVVGALVLAGLALFLVRMYNRRKRREAQQTIRMSVWRHSQPEKLERGSWGKGYRDEPEDEGVRT